MKLILFLGISGVFFFMFFMLVLWMVMLFVFMFLMSMFFIFMFAFLVFLRFMFTFMFMLFYSFDFFGNFLFKLIKKVLLIRFPINCYSFNRSAKFLLVPLPILLLDSIPLLTQSIILSLFKIPWLYSLCQQLSNVFIH